jgi:hypothetical protein
MGFNQSTLWSSDNKVSKSDLFGAVLAGFGIWTKPSPKVQQDSSRTTVVSNNVYPLNTHPLRVVRVKDVNPQMAGRMVISGRMADVCAELDRLAA